MGIRNWELGVVVKKDNVVQNKSYAFSVRIIKACKPLIENKREYVMSRQLLKAGTSIGANVEEAIGGQSKKDFFAKMNIAYKEARESKYWLRLLRDTEYLDAAVAESLLGDVDELLRLIGSILKTVRGRLGD